MNENENEAAGFESRLRRVAVDVILPPGLDVKRAVTLAEDMVASGVGQAATLAVAILDRDALASDAQQPVRDMLAEHGIDVQRADGERAEYELLLRAFGYWDLPLSHFEGPFYGQIPEWDGQGSLDRELVTLLDQRDYETAPEARAAIEGRMREAVRRHVARR